MAILKVCQYLSTNSCFYPIKIIVIAGVFVLSGLVELNVEKIMLIFAFTQVLDENVQT